MYITDIEVNGGGKAAIFFNLIKMTFLRTYPSLKPHILSHSINQRTDILVVLIIGLIKW